MRWRVAHLEVRSRLKVDCEKRDSELAVRYTELCVLFEIHRMKRGRTANNNFRHILLVVDVVQPRPATSRRPLMWLDTHRICTSPSTRR
jgi:hypothetical protein